MIHKSHLWACKSAFIKILATLTGSSLSRFTGESQSQLVGDAERGQNILDNQCFRANKKIFQKK
jgi:hypothetical protein